MTLVEAISGREASAMLVAFARERSTHVAQLEQQHEVEVGSLTARVAGLEQQLAETETRLRRVRRRVRRLRHRLEQAAPAQGRFLRLFQRLRQLR